MNQNLIWLSTSVFCVKGQRHLVLNSCIDPFTIKMKSEGWLEAYTIEFNYLSGENIRLALLTKNEHAETLAMLTDRHFTDFFSRFEQPPNIAQPPIAGVFLPFPNNSIQYGLYQPRKIGSMEVKEKYYSRIVLSRVMVEALKDDEIDEEVILTFAFYLSLALINVVHKTKYIPISTVLRYFNTSMAPTILPGEIVNEKFVENKQMLSEIADDVMESRQLPAWVNRWQQLCENIIADRSSLELTDSIRQITYIISIHLGITENMNHLLRIFLQNTLQTNSAGNVIE